MTNEFKILKPRELMIGDWVLNSKKEICKVCALGSIYSDSITLNNYDRGGNDQFELEESVFPIKLTRAIIENSKTSSSNSVVNGIATEFFFDDDWNVSLDIFEETYFRFCCTYDIYDSSNSEIFFYIKYVHELQHLLNTCELDPSIIKVL